MTQATGRHALNGVDVPTLFATLDAVKGAPEPGGPPCTAVAPAPGARHERRVGRRGRGRPGGGGIDRDAAGPRRAARPVRRADPAGERHPLHPRADARGHAPAREVGPARPGDRRGHPARSGTRSFTTAPTRCRFPSARRLASTRSTRRAAPSSTGFLPRPRRPRARTSGPGARLSGWSVTGRDA